MSDDDDKIDLESWEPQLPPTDFAERVLAQVRAEGKSGESGESRKSESEKERETRSGTVAARATARTRRRRWGNAAGVAGVMALAAALMMRVTGGAAAHGEAIAKDRIEVAIGTRALAVLEPGAQVKWDGDDVVQDHGDVFYRVEPGARFRVHTPAGDVEVKGTCFAVKVRGEAQSNAVIQGADMNKRDVKSGVVGAALSAFAFVAVYEGKVAVSHASEHADLSAGEGAQLGAGGVTKSGALGEGEKSFDARAAANAAGDVPLAKANENLVAQVSEYRARLEAIAAQKVALEQTLKNTEQKLASQSDGGRPPKTEFDLGPEDWKELSKEGTIKFMVPCSRESGWLPKPETLQKLALAPQDGPVLQTAYKNTNTRLWTVIRPLCAAEVGSEKTADRIGLDTCIHLVLDSSSGKDREAANEAMRQVGEVRAGLRPDVEPTLQGSPVVKMFSALTAERKLFEGELAQSLGPEEAHRVTFAEGMCMHTSSFGGPGPRPDPKTK
jgi:ferric-dicitrate binding protein FerR (iron transport regulator)